LNASQQTGIELTESFAMLPAASVCGLYFAHPESRYFSITRIGEDQLDDYARRKSMTTAQARRWLSPLLAD
jgi:5-methyltetrahydrofolate--homocysteine methyltransferase